jgi:hypothetical protein
LKFVLAEKVDDVLSAALMSPGDSTPNGTGPKPRKKRVKQAE